MREEVTRVGATPEADRRGHLVVFGCRGVGRRIVKQLSTTVPEVVVVDPDATSAEREELYRWGVEYLPGSGQSIDILELAGCDSARAVVIATNVDLLNIEIALLVREMSPTVRIVVQVANASVGRAMTSVARPGAVFDVAALASTSFVEAVLDRTTHEISLGGVDFVVASLHPEAEGTIRSTWGDMAPVAIVPGDGGQTIACPSRDHAVAPGDLVTIMGARDDFRSAGIRPEVPRATPSSRPLRRRVRETLAAINDTVDLPFRVSGAVLIGLGVLSVLVLTRGYIAPDGTGMSLLDAVYFTSETIATVGFGDFYFRDQDAWLRVWAIFITLFGASLIAVATALLTNAMVSRSLAQSLGRQRLTGMSDHIVVIGLGAVGSKVTMELRAAGFEVAVIDGGDGRRFIPRMGEIGVPVLIGDATVSETQQAAGVDRAAGVAVLTNDDLVNIETGLAVRGLVGDRPVPIALRLFGRNLARVIGAGLDAGVPRSIAELAAPWFIGAALGMEVLGTFYVGATPFMAARLRVRRGGGLDGLPIDELRERTRVVAIRRAGGAGPLEHRLPRETLLHADDDAYLIGHYEEIFEVLAREAEGSAYQRASDVDGTTADVPG